ncbi:hypothetical protein GIB67_032186, partial [Kingdonia uniflora]
FCELVNIAFVRHSLPFSFVEYEGVRNAFNYTAYANRDIKLVSQNTSKADILKMYKREKALIQKMLLEVPKKISLTSDLSSPVIRDCYCRSTLTLTTGGSS